MQASTIAVLHECSTRSQAGSITFPQVVGKLIEAGVESYHADFYRREKTYYLPNGESHIEALAPPAAPIATSFSAAGVEAAVRSIQRGEIKYMEFLGLCLLAGCASYYVYLQGRCAVYVGRDGDHLIEPFPGN
jgi:uncharacterized protein YbcV (DUF1398 family)